MASGKHFQNRTADGDSRSGHCRDRRDVGRIIYLGGLQRREGLGTLRLPVGDGRGAPIGSRSIGLATPG